MYALFHRDETKPTHIIGISSFLFWMQLVYKHASPNYQHMISHGELINKMLVYVCVCVSWNIFNRIHVFASCDVPCVQLVRCYMKLYMIGRKVDEAASTNSSSSSYTTDFTLLHDCINTVILAEQSLHHNIILEKLDHSCVSRVCTKIVISESHTTSLLHI